MSSPAAAPGPSQPPRPEQAGDTQRRRSRRVASHQASEKLAAGMEVAGSEDDAGSLDSSDSGGGSQANQGTSSDEHDDEAEDAADGAAEQQSSDGEDEYRPRAAATATRKRPRARASEGKGKAQRRRAGQQQVAMPLEAAAAALSAMDRAAAAAGGAAAAAAAAGGGADQLAGDDWQLQLAVQMSLQPGPGDAAPGRGCSPQGQAEPVLLLDSSSQDDGEGEQQPRGGSNPQGGRRPPRSRSKSTPATKPPAKRAAVAKRSQPAWLGREQLWLLFQRLSPNAAGIVSTAGIEQQQQEAGLLADQALAGRMLSVARSLAEQASGGFNADAAAGGLDFETFVVAAQHAASL